MSENNTNVPKIRFPGFTDSWEQRKAEEIFKTVSDKGHSELPVLSASQQLGMVRRDENGIDIQFDKKSVVNYKRVLPKQFVIHLRSFQGGFAHSSLEGITSPAYTIIDFKSENTQSDLFWNEIFTSKKFIKRLETVTYGIRDGRSISFNDFKTLLFTLPSYKEQEQIAGFFSDLNNLITLHQRKLEHLQDRKKGLLQKMFPKNGADVPEIRFPGFTHAWERRKLDEIASFSKGAGYSKGDLVPEGKPIILYGRLYTKYETVIKNIDTFVKEKENSVISCGNEIIVPASGETSDDISRASVVGKPGIIIGGDLNIIKTKDELDPTFLALTISNGKQQKELSKRAQGKSVVHLHNSDLKEVRLFYPKKEEQIKIGTFFKQLDNLITLHQRKLNHLQEQKKALFQQMFV